MAFLSPTSTAPENDTSAIPESLSHPQKLRLYQSRGYIIRTDGMSGTELIGPRRFSTGDKVMCGIGVLLLPFGGFGLLLMLFAWVDYMWLCKRDKVWIDRN